METVIADAGPLVAYLKRDDKDHGPRALSPLEDLRRACADLLTEPAPPGSRRSGRTLSQDNLDRPFELIAPARTGGSLGPGMPVSACRW
jgi:hypothetical protein